MESWVPLFDIFLNSPCPETDASRWLQQSFNASSPATATATTTTITTNSFLSLLSEPSDAIVIDSSSPSPSSPPHTKRIMWMQTLPNTVQSRILSFLALEHRRFGSRDLTKLAQRLLSETEGLDFWVNKAAHQLLDIVSESNHEFVSRFDLDSEEGRVENDFESLPDWLRDKARDSESLLPWLPITRDELNWTMLHNVCGENADSVIEVEDDDDEEEQDVNETMMEVDIVNDPIDPHVEKMAACLKARVLNFESTSKTVSLASEIRQLCLERRGDSLTVLGAVEPWKGDDETASILVSNLSDGSEEELGWSSHVLCTIVLPKLLVLEEPASRVLVTATIEYCKVHQRAAVYALMFPLILRKEGINKAICDVIARIIKECLHPAHVSSFCQKLLCGEDEMSKFICLPCHQCLISPELVWTESLFNLFQSILNHNVHLTRDSVDQLVNRVQELAVTFSKSLKFGNFVLCLVNKCAPLLKSHKLSLSTAVEHTETLVTKSILSKLAIL